MPAPEYRDGEHKRIREAYVRMAQEAKYRPAALGDGVGGISLSDEDLNNPDVLAKEATEYATRFIAEEDSGKFEIGISNYSTNRAFVWTIEASRLLCSGGSSAPLALKLLEMAAEDVKSFTR